VADGFVFKDYLAVGLEVFVVVVACHGVSFVGVMLLAPLASPAVAFSTTETRVFVPPTFHSCVLLAAGLFRVEHQSPFV
jgi:hypothetical protein